MPTPESDERTRPEVVNGPFDDSMLTRPWPWLRYVSFSLRLYASSAPWSGARLLRVLVTLGGAFLPAVACGVLLWMMGLPLEQQRSYLQSDWVLEDSLASMGLPLSPALLGGVFGVVLTLIAMRGLADSIWFGALASTSRSGRPGLFYYVSQSSLGFSILATLRLGLTTGAVMFLSPFFRVLGRLLISEGSTSRTEWFAAISLVCSLLAVAYIQFFVSLASAHLVWRPRFLAGTIVSALAAPFRQWSIYGRLLPLWFLSHGVAWSGGAFAVSGLLSVWGEGGNHDTWTLAAAMIAGVGFIGGALWDCLLVTIVGQRIGDIRIRTRELSSAPEPAQTPRMAAAPDQTRFDPPVRGSYSTSAQARTVPDSIVRFDDVVAPESPESAAGWTVEGAEAAPQSEPLETLSGLMELVVDVGSTDPVVSWSELASGPVTPPGLSWNDGGADSLHELAPGRAVHVASGGAPERVWRPPPTECA